MDTGTRTATRLRETVAEEVRALLGRRRLSGAKLAVAIDRSEMYVSRRLRGETAFDLDDLERIAHVLDVKVADLLPRGYNVGYASSDDQLSRLPEWPVLAAVSEAATSDIDLPMTITPQPIAARHRPTDRPTAASHRPPGRPEHGGAAGPRPERPRIARPVTPTV